jgi:hypothetical protein
VESARLLCISLFPSEKFRCRMRTTADLRRVLFESPAEDGAGSPQASAIPAARKTRFLAETQLVQGLQQPRRPPVLRAPDGKELVDNKMPLGANGEPLTLAYVPAVLCIRVAFVYATAGYGCRALARQRPLASYVNGQNVAPHSIGVLLCSPTHASCIALYAHPYASIWLIASLPACIAAT